MAVVDINWKPTPRAQWWFVGFWLPAFFLLLGGILLWRTGSFPVSMGVWAVGGVITALGCFVPTLRRPLWIGWMCAAYPMGWIVSHLLLAAIFYLVVTPVGIVMRLVGRDPLRRTMDRSASTYWIPHTSETDVSRYFRQY